MHFDTKNYKKYYDFNVLDHNYYILNNNLLKNFLKKVGAPQNGAKIAKNEQKIRKIVKKLVLNAF